MLNIKEGDSYIIKMSKARAHLIKKGEVEKAQDMVRDIFHNHKQVDQIIKKYIDEKKY